MLVTFFPPEAGKGERFQLHTDFRLDIRAFFCCSEGLKESIVRATNIIVSFGMVKINH